MRLFRPGWITGFIYPGVISRIDTPGKEICLTFDDGPDPLSTPEILKLLGHYSIKGIFFCNGKQAERNPGLMDMIRSGGHLTGNHTYSHINGWKISSDRYLDDVEKAACFTSGTVFRPPYGRMKPSQFKMLRENYVIFIWDLMPYDFDADFGPENSLKIMKKRIRPGSVIVLHDSPSSSVLRILPEFIGYALEQGYCFVQPY